MATRFPAWVDVAVGLLMVGVVVSVDYFTGYEISLAFFYLLPLFYVGWRVGFGWALVIAAASAGAGVATDLATGSPFKNFYYAAWEAAIRMGVFAAVAFTLSKWKAALERESRLARTDALTGAVNRMHFLEILEAEIERSRRYGRGFSVAYLDLDGFKEVNDTLGHEAGDELLREVVRCVQGCLRRTDAMARLGGDEFCVLMPETGPDQVTEAVQKLRSALDADSLLSRHGVTFSAGVLACPAAVPSADAVLRQADQLLYAAKAAGRGRICTGRMAAGARAPDRTEEA